MKTETKADERIKLEAFTAEHSRFMNTSETRPRDIYAKCSDGVHVRKAWEAGRHCGWHEWSLSAEPCGDPCADCIHIITCKLPRKEGCQHKRTTPMSKGFARIHSGA